MPLSKTLTYNKADNSAQGTQTTNDKVFDWIIMPYLYGEEIDEIRHRLSGPHPVVKKDFKHCPIHDKPQDDYLGYDQKAKQILIILGITDIEKQKQYLNAKQCNNVYQLLCHLYRDGHHHLATLIDMIDKSAPKHNLLRFGLPTFLASALVLAGFLWDKYAHDSFKQALRKFANGIDLLSTLAQSFLSSAKNIAFIGMGINLGQLLYEAVVTRFDEKRNLRSKLYGFGFTLGASLLAITSYAITVITNGALSTVAAWLFVLSSAVAVSKAIDGLRQAHAEFKEYETTFAKEHGGKTVYQSLADNQLTLQETAEYYRSLYHFKARRMALVQEIFTAIAVVFVIASWSFALLFPPSSVALVASSVAMLTLIQTLHTYFAEKSKQHFDNGLQKKLKELSNKGFKDEVQRVCISIQMNPISEPTFNPLTALLENSPTEDAIEMVDIAKPQASSALVASTITNWLHLPSLFNNSKKQEAIKEVETTPLLNAELDNSQHRL